MARGGARRGSGPKAKERVEAAPVAAEIDWVQVKRFADIGSSEAEIIQGLGITDAQLKDSAVAQRLRAAVTQGTAFKALVLQETIHKVAMGDSKGGANTLALEARNRLDWDKQIGTQEQAPDLTSAHARLRLTLERLAKVKSEEEGRDVSPVSVLLSLISVSAGDH